MFMRLSEVVEKLNNELRPGLASEWDRVGLIVGNPQIKVKRIGVALDAEEEVIWNCRKKRIDLLITHHPPFLKPLETVVADSVLSGRIYQLIECGVALYSAHTNLDVLPWGTGYQLCKRLGMEYAGPLVQLKNAYGIKLVTFVPPSSTKRVRTALAKAGAGDIGNYSFCSFSAKGEGSFLPMKGANPTLGKVGSLEFCKEDRLEMVVPADRSGNVIEALKKSHPYEEPAYDLVPLKNISENAGWGAIGITKKPVKAADWLRMAKKALRIKYVKAYAWNPKRYVRKAALMPGSGGDFIGAVKSDFDLYLSGDIKYHDLQNARKNIMIIDSGHDATEMPVLTELKRRIQRLSGMNAEIIEQKIRGELSV